MKLRRTALGRPVGPGAALLPLTVAAVMLSACDPVTHYRAEPAALQDVVDCSVATGMISVPSGPDAPLKGRVPDGFVPVDAVRCIWELPAVSGQATTSPRAIIRVEHLTGDYTALLAALAQPSDRGGSANCIDIAEILPEVWLVNAAGGAVHVQWPLDSCEKSKPATATALAKLTVTETTTIEARETPS